MIFIIIYFRDKVFNYFESHLIDYLEKIIKDKKVEIKRIFISYFYFKEYICQINQL